MSTVVGIDPSLTSAGIAVLRDGRPVLLTSVGHASPNGQDYSHRSDRIVSQCRAVINAIAGLPSKTPDWVTGSGLAIDLAVIEGPAYGQHLPSNHDRAGLWWGLYSALRAKRVPTAVVAPKTRAKWATGRGDAKKPAVLAAVRATWPTWAHHIRNDDIADALTLAAMGALHHGDPLPFPPRNYQHNGLESVTWPERTPA